MRKNDRTMHIEPISSAVSKEIKKKLKDEAHLDDCTVSLKVTEIIEFYYRDDK